MADARDGFSKLRNHAIGAALEYMGEVEGWGGGVLRYFSSCAEMGLAIPTLTEEGGCLRVTFYRRKGVVKSKEKSKEKGKEKGKEKSKEKSKEKILAFIAKNPECTSEDIAHEIGLSRSGIEKNIRLLKQSGLLQRSGGDRGGQWVVCDK